jgi:pyruvate/2-oxoglutarate dehydrogenase complex dihydrolipoamide dehydrogenase (E3) component
MASKYAKYDFIIIGGRAATFSAAIKTNMHNVKTAIIERAALGGTCVNVGCWLHAEQEPTWR